MSTATLLRLSLRLSFFLVTSLFGHSNSCLAQVSIWSVDFESGYSDNDLTAQDNNLPVGADWTKSGTPSNWWRVESDNVISGSLSMSGRNTDGVMTWTSESIDISNHTDIAISIDLTEVNCEGGDIIETFYDIGSGNVEFGDGNGDGNFNSATNTVSALNGSALTIVVTLNNNGGGERLIFDNVSVTGFAVSSGQGPDGPGGVGDTDGSGNLSLWLDANQGVTASGTAITTWADQSGYGNDATPPLTANRPTFTDPGINSHPLVSFDGSSDYLTSADDNSLDLTTWSIITVGKITTNKNYNAFVVKGTDANENYEFLTNFPGTGNIHYPVKFTTSARSTDSEAGETYSNSVYGVYQLDYDQSNFQIYIDGDLTETDAETRTPQTNSNSLYIGNEQGTSNRELSGLLGEVIMYSEPLNDAERIIVHNAMSAKYGFALDANDVYDEDDNGYDFDVAGIGQAADGSNHQAAKGTGIVTMENPSDLDNSEFLIWGHDDGALSSFGILDFPVGTEARLARVWRASETSDVGTVDISFDLIDVFGSFTASDLRLLIDRTGNGLFIDELASGIISGATNTSGNVYQWTGIDLANNERFTVASINSAQTPLPIELIRFEAWRSDDHVELTWATATETNNDYFVIERSAGNNKWENVFEVSGAGHSNFVIEYYETDYEAPASRLFYRLKQIDFNGDYTYSNIRVVPPTKVLNEENTIRIFPNPIERGSRLNVEMNNFDNKDVLLVFRDINGREFYTKMVYVSEDSVFEVVDVSASIPAGNYIITATSNQEVIGLKLIVK